MGRDFRSDDGAPGSPPVGIGNERFARSLMFGVDALDPAVAAAALAVMVVISLAAVLLPARRAERLDLAEVLRGE